MNSKKASTQWSQTLDYIGTLDETRTPWRKYEHLDNIWPNWWSEHSRTSIKANTRWKRALDEAGTLNEIRILDKAENLMELEHLDKVKTPRSILNTTKFRHLDKVEHLDYSWSHIPKKVDITRTSRWDQHTLMKLNTWHDQSKRQVEIRTLDKLQTLEWSQKGISSLTDHDDDNNDDRYNHNTKSHASMTTNSLTVYRKTIGYDDSVQYQ